MGKKLRAIQEKKCYKYRGQMLKKTYNIVILQKPLGLHIRKILETDL
jgi:hypothetical protein